MILRKEQGGGAAAGTTIRRGSCGTLLWKKQLAQRPLGIPAGTQPLSSGRSGIANGSGDTAARPTGRLTGSFVRDPLHTRTHRPSAAFPQSCKQTCLFSRLRHAPSAAASCGLQANLRATCLPFLSASSAACSTACRLSALSSHSSNSSGNMFTVACGAAPRWLAQWPLAVEALAPQRHVGTRLQWRPECPVLLPLLQIPCHHGLTRKRWMTSRGSLSSGSSSFR